MNPGTLRILDANFNRAREALRVVEDYARFVLDDDGLSIELKQLRHDLAGAVSRWTEHALLLRDTPGDVGTDNKTQSELAREDTADVVTASGKRLGEALRTVEEYLKTLSSADAAKVELIRYHFYDIELRVGRTLKPANRFADVRLYVLITEATCKRPWLEVAEAVIAGGADCLQLREKDLESGELLRRAKALVGMCHDAGVLCIINDRPDIALLSGADGVHVGQTDLPATAVRKLLGPDKLVGVSTHRLEQAKQARLDGADYLGVGPVFRSPTKPRDILPGLAYAAEVAAQVPMPTVAIAGITQANVDEVLATGVRAVAVTAAVAGSDDPRGACERLKAKLMRTPPSHAVGQTFLSARLGKHSHPPLVSPQSTGGVDILVCPEEPSAQPLVPSQPNLGGTNFPVSPDQPTLEKYGRRLPHWRLEGATYFITFRVRDQELTPAERSIVFDHVRSCDPQYYTLIAAVVMPDHVHLLLHPNGGVELSRITKGTKGVTARKVNEFRGTRGNLWQDESWDRIVRDQGELDEKVEYCLGNPLKRGLVEDPWDYPWWYYKPLRD